MGKAIRNFKDGINGVEEAKFRHLSTDGEPKPEIKTAEAKSDDAPQPAPESDKPQA